MRTSMPKYRHYPPRNLAYVECKELYPNKRRHYLGRWRSKESKAAYADCCAKLAALRSGDPAKVAKIRRGKLTVAHLMSAFMKDRIAIKGEGRRTDTRHYKTIQSMMLEDQFVKLKCDEFDQVKLRELRQAMVEMNWSRRYINRQIARVRTMFRWGVDRKMVTWETLGNLTNVKALKKRESKAKELKKKKGTTLESISAVLPHLAPMVAAMVQFHYLQGCRSDDVCSMRGEEIDRSGKVWLYEREEHKTDYADKEKIIQIGPIAQKIIAKYVVDEGYLFTPRIAELERREARRANRKTPVYGKTKKRKPKDRKGLNDHYDVSAYQHAINFGFEKLAKEKTGAVRRPTVPAINSKGEKVLRKPKLIPWLKSQGVVYWHPHQLRHTRATEIEKQYGIEAAQAVLGNTINATLIYAHNSGNLANKVAEEIG